MLEEVSAHEAPRAAYFLTREDALTGEREDGLSTDTKEMRCLVDRQYLRIFLHLLLTPGPVPELTLLGGYDSHGDASTDRQSLDGAHEIERTYLDADGLAHRTHLQTRHMDTCRD